MTHQLTLKRCCRGDECKSPNGPNMTATSDNFSASKRNKDGLQNICRECSRAASRSRNHSLDNARRSGAINQWREENPSKVKSQAASYYQSHADEAKQRSRTRYEDNPQVVKDRAKSWRQNNPGATKIQFANRRARKRNLPNTLTRQEWINCLSYWRNKCAYCEGEAQHADHFIPLSQKECPGTVVENMLPSCAKCNLTKHDNDPYRWVYSRFGASGNGIMFNIEAYFCFVRRNANAKPNA